MDWSQTESHAKNVAFPPGSAGPFSARFSPLVFSLVLISHSSSANTFIATASGPVFDNAGPRVSRLLHGHPPRRRGPNGPRNHHPRRRDICFASRSRCRAPRHSRHPHRRLRLDPAEHARPRRRLRKTRPLHCLRSRLYQRCASTRIHLPLQSHAATTNPSPQATQSRKPSSPSSKPTPKPPPTNPNPTSSPAPSKKPSPPSPSSPLSSASSSPTAPPPRTPASCPS